MEKMPVWSEKRTVRFSAVDKSNTMTLDAVMNYFQEAAVNHAENLGVGHEALAEIHQGWVLSRMSVQIDRRPKCDENITIRTWPRGSEKMLAIRDFDIIGADEIPVIRARSGWIIIDTEKRRPLRPQTVTEKLPSNEGLDAMTAATGLAEHQFPLDSLKRTAAYTDLDYNGHVNNVSYVKWIEDTMDPVLLEKAEHMRLDINYTSEILPGEVTEIRFVPIDPSDNATSQTFAFEGRKQRDNQPVFRAELRLR